MLTEKQFVLQILFPCHSDIWTFMVLFFLIIKINGYEPEGSVIISHMTCFVDTRLSVCISEVLVHLHLYIHVNICILCMFVCPGALCECIQVLFVVPRWSPAGLP